MEPQQPTAERITTVLTANRRQAAQLQYLHDLAQQQAGEVVWESLDVLPWEAWLRRLWEEWLVTHSGSTPRLLSPSQERLLWEQVIQDSSCSEGLLQPTATARRAQEAWRLLHAYQQALPATSGQTTVDVEAFTAWAIEFQRRCEERHWLDSARLAAHLERCLQGDALALPDELQLNGFDELSPAQRALLAAVERRGCAVDEVRREGVAGDVKRVPCSDAEGEIAAAARWTRTLLAQGNPGRIGIVVHDLAAQRKAVQRLFDDTLNPGGVLPGAAQMPLFNISLGQPLADFPVVTTALTLLELGGDLRALEVERLGALLRSPFLEGGEPEAGQRARLDAALRQFGESRIGINTLIFFAREGTGAAPLAAERFAAWRGHREQLPFRQSAAAWARDFAESLRQAGWPRGRSLDSNEFQAVEAWRSALGQLVALDDVAGLLSYRQAFGKLRQLATETLFQPCTPELPVQILGLLEAEGLTFDHLWIVGWHDEVWPAAARPHPLLPIAMQRRCQMPHSSAARELQFARGVTERLLAAAPDVVVSWPRREADRELRPSPLIDALPETDLVALGAATGATYPETVFASAGTESVEDDIGLPFPDAQTTRGGAAVFKEQAACPFRAYARFRLGGEPLGDPQPGLDAATRGSLLHRALENFWSAVSDHASLLRLDAPQRRSAIAEAVRFAVEAEARRRPATFNARFTAIEQSRLEQRLSAWLTIEAERAPFRVLATEAQREVTVGKLPVQARIDRIDQLDDGRRVIIDYKSGKSSVQAWIGERPDEPQLPLYAVSETEPLAALAFAELRPGECRFRGLARESDLLPAVDHKARGVDPEWRWEALVAEWRLTLEELAAAFRAGDARVDPKKAETCRYCALTALCRIAEAEWLEEISDND